MEPREEFARIKEAGLLLMESTPSWTAMGIWCRPRVEARATPGSLSGLRAGPGVEKAFQQVRSRITAMFSTVPKAKGYALSEGDKASSPPKQRRAVHVLGEQGTTGKPSSSS